MMLLFPIASFPSPDPTPPDYSCPECNGDRFVPCCNCHGTDPHCPECDEDGERQCDTCDGRGWVR